MQKELVTNINAFIESIGMPVLVFDSSLRLKYFNEQRTTSHWPCPIKVNSLQPRTFGNDDILIDYDSLPMNDLSEFKEEIMKII